MIPHQRLKEIERLLSESFIHHDGDYVRLHRENAGLALRLAREGGDGWVSVGDKLPDFNQPVLAYCPIYGRSVRIYLEIHDTGYGNWDDPETGGMGGLPPSHWQPLPSPPKDPQADPSAA